MHIVDLFAGSGYASAYYVYLWAEVLDAGVITFLCVFVLSALLFRKCVLSSHEHFFHSLRSAFACLSILC